ncbi:D-lactaldehyde dehydrogenase [Mycena polygramma]|nr:D-lactaldehyde dehydrogenase [Mycena polygramma]
MPALSSGKVLVSGANGFIAAWAVRKLLEEGFSVRGTVRSETKGAHLRKMFASYGDKFELAVVPDITQEGAFDEAVQGVDAIAHTASPVALHDGEPEEVIGPAVQGTLSILTSALKYGTSVKRVVYTSSTAAVLQVEPEPKTFSELDWNEQAPREAKELGRAASGITKYRASKVLAERAAWDFVEKHKGEIGWDLVALNPPYVHGPMIHEVSTPDALGLSMAPPEALQTGNCWVDVRDVPRALVLALLREPAGGERIIIDAGPFVWQEWLDALPDSPKYQKGVRGAGKNVVDRIRYDASKSKRVLGMEYHSLEDTARDTIADWEARGW